MNIIVTGGRFYTDKQRVFDQLDELYNQLGENEYLHIFEGGAEGADYFARQWIRRRKQEGWRIKHTRVNADWNLYGKAAGGIRNQEMLDLSCPDLVLAFPGHKGTRDMINRARKAGVKIIKTEDWARLEGALI